MIFATSRGLNKGLFDVRPRLEVAGKHASYQIGMKVKVC